MRDEAFEDGGVDGKVIDALLGLLDEGVAVEFPSEAFDLAVHFFKCLIDGDGSDGDGRITNDPLAGGVDVFSGGKVHHGVGTPLGGPSHFFDFFIDGRGDGGVADVGVDFHEEIPPDDHGLDFWMVDVGRDDGTAAGDLGADELGSDKIWDLGSIALAGVLMVHHITRDLFHGVDLAGARHFVTFRSGVFLTNELFDLIRGVFGEFVESGIMVVNGFELFKATVIFADGDELHLRCDDALIGIPLLGHGLDVLAATVRLEAGALKWLSF